MTNVVAGLDLDSLDHAELNVTYPDIVPGRRIHIDADFGCYQATYRKEDSDEEPKSWDDMTHSISVLFEHLKQLAGAEHAVLHLTPAGSDKGGRYTQATTKEYQANRAEKAKPEYLEKMRRWLVDGAPFQAVAHMNQEADDGMAIEAWKALDGDFQDLCVICSADKDLLMVPGLHLHPMTGNLTDLGKDTFGHIELDASGSAKKVVGRGTKFFWAQMLMGDVADNIPGLHKVSGKDVSAIAPSAAVKKSQAKLADWSAGDLKLSDKQVKMHMATLEAAKAKSCGAVMAYTIIEPIKNDAEAFEVIKNLYRNQPDQLIHWDTAEDVSWSEALTSNGQLLWMRRDENPDDFLNWMMEVMN